MIWSGLLTVSLVKVEKIAVSLAGHLMLGDDGLGEDYGFFSEIETGGGGKTGTELTVGLAIWLLAAPGAVKASAEGDGVAGSLEIKTFSRWSPILYSRADELVFVISFRCRDSNCQADGDGNCNGENAYQRHPNTRSKAKNSIIACPAAAVLIC